MKVWVLRCGFVNEPTWDGIFGVYTSEHLAQRAAAQFIECGKDDEEYLGRWTAISDQTLDHGWFEEHWLR